MKVAAWAALVVVVFLVANLPAFAMEDRWGPRLRLMAGTTAFAIAATAVIIGLVHLAVG